LLFGSLISATDPVAVLSIFSSRPIDSNLYAVIFGESLLNDSASIVMYETILRFMSREIDAQNVVVAIGDFFVIFVGSILVGVGSALLATLFFKHVRVKEYPMLEVSLFVVFSLTPYFLAQGLGLSGIVAILFVGIIMAHYTYFNISKANRLLTKQIYHLFAHVSETFLFLYLGVELFIYDRDFSLSLVLASIFIVLVSRAVNVFPLMRIANCSLPENQQFNGKKQFIVWLSGLRGAVAFALAVLADKKGDPDVGESNPRIENAGKIVTTTLIVCVVTMFGGGFSVYYMLDKLGLVIRDQQAAAEEAQDRIEQRTQEVGRFLYLDRRYFKPFLTNRHVTSVQGVSMDFVDSPSLRGSGRARASSNTNVDNA